MLTLHEGPQLTVQIGGRWLYPLFLLVLAGRQGAITPFPSQRNVSVTDPKIGRGAVFLYKTIGIRSATGEIVSELARVTAEEQGIELNQRTTVPSLECATEELLTGVSDPKHALTLLEGRLSAEFRSDPRQFVTIEVVSESEITRALTAFLQAH